MAIIIILGNRNSVFLSTGKILGKNKAFLNSLSIELKTDLVQ